MPRGRSWGLPLQRLRSDDLARPPPHIPVSRPLWYILGCGSQITCLTSTPKSSAHQGKETRPDLSVTTTQSRPLTACSATVRPASPQLFKRPRQTWLLMYCTPAPISDDAPPDQSVAARSRCGRPVHVDPRLARAASG